MTVQWLVTALLVALCLAYVIKTMLPKAGAAACAGGCKGCSSAGLSVGGASGASAKGSCLVSTPGNAAQPLVFHPPQKRNF
jgi:hypothetical protein